LFGRDQPLAVMDARDLHEPAVARISAAAPESVRHRRVMRPPTVRVAIRADRVSQRGTERRPRRKGCGGRM